MLLSGGLVREIAESPWFQRTDMPYLIVDTGLRIRAVNEAYEVATDRPHSSLVNEWLFDAFPDNPSDPLANGVSRLSASLEAVFRTGKRHWMGVQRYDIPDPTRPGSFRYKVWTPVNTPIHQGERVVGAVHHVEDVTPVVHLDGSGVSWQQIEESARELRRQFPALPCEAVLGAVAHSHRLVLAALGRPDPTWAEELATVRLELLAGHPRMGAPATSHLPPRLG